MQEFMPIPGLARRLFGGAADPPDLRRSGAPLPPEEVRCPRCDSANTKFCYYNNYNLSQPRHFCKTCRRYWTKGGLLRNVPVGGRCRKPNRPAAAAAAADVDNRVGAHRDAKNPRSGCTGGSSGSPTASAASASNTVGAAAAAHSSGGSTTATGVGPSAFPTDALPLPAPMFADQAAAFASLFAPPPPLPAFSFSAQPKAEEDVAPAHTLTEQPSSASFTADHMAQFSVRSGGAAMASATAWPPAAVDAAGIFDLAGDSSLYCNLVSWTDPDGTIYLP